jgi:hypothetical protein
MNTTKKVISGLAALSMLASGCAASQTTSTAAAASASTASVVTNLSKIDNTKWQYNSDADVYYQIGVSYCETPANSTYENLAVFVPGGYFTGKQNSDGTYTVSVNDSAKVGSYTASTAPVVMPINTPGYMAQAALTEYQDESTYTKQGFVYVLAGCRGRDDGAPAGVTDIKAAIRYLRYSADTLAGSMDNIFVFGMSGGGAQSAIVGASGDSSLYDKYLTAIGAVQGVSDAVAGSMDWCPITNLDTADESYEWMMGSTRSGLSTSDQAVSDGLANAWAEWVNQAGLKDENGNALTLEKSSTGIYQSGSYYNYVKTQIETSLNNFLSDNTFPYDSSSSTSSMGGMTGGAAGGMMGGMKGGMTGGTMPAMGTDTTSGSTASAGTTTGEAPSADTTTGSSINAGGTAGGTTTGGANDQIARSTTSSISITLSGTYQTAQDYIDALNADGTWVTYDASTNKATITSVADFCKAMKAATKSLGAFDQLDAGQGENTLFGYADGNGAHFDSLLAAIVKGTDYESAFTTDLAKKDSVGNTVDVRLNMYTPLYYLLQSYDGYGTSTVAKYWRIRTGISQGDTALTTEMNLALALENNSSVKSVDFASVWGMQHTMAERTGDSTTNFCTWVNQCMGN